MGRLNLTLEDDTLRRLARAARGRELATAALARRLLTDALQRLETAEAAGTWARAYEQGAADTLSLVRDVEGGQLDLLAENAQANEPVDAYGVEPADDGVARWPARPLLLALR